MWAEFVIFANKTIFMQSFRRKLFSLVFWDSYFQIIKVADFRTLEIAVFTIILIMPDCQSEICIRHSIK